jgi:transposase
VANPTKKQRRERFVSIVAEPEALDMICDRVSDGETLADLAREFGCNYRWLHEWLHDEGRPERAKALSAAVAARDSLMREDVIGQLHRLGNLDIREAFDVKGNMLPVHKLSAELAKAVTSVDTTEDALGKTTRKIKFVDRAAMLQLTGRRQQLFTDNVKVEGDIGFHQLVTDAEGLVTKIRGKGAGQ